MHRSHATRPKTNSTGSMAPLTTSSSSTTDNKHLKKQQTEPALSHKPALAPKPAIASKKKPLRSLKKQKSSGSQSPSPEHLSKEAVGEDGSTNVTPEPQLANSGTTSPVPDSSDLDHIPRSSPQVPRDLRSSLKGRLSPQSGRLTKSVTTPALHSETYDVPKSLQTQLSAEDGGGLYNNVSLSGEAPESDSTYQVPRRTVDSEYHVPRHKDDVLNEKRYYHHPKPTDEVYKVPRPMSGTYSSLLLGHTPDNVYSSPRPPVGGRSPQGVYYSYPPDADGSDSAISTDHGQGVPSTTQNNSSETSGQLYGNISSTASNRTDVDSEENFYNVPRPGADLDSREQEQEVVDAASGDDGLYNVPRPIIGSQQEVKISPPADEDLYKVPRSSSGGRSNQQVDDGVYKIPRSVKQSGSESPPLRNPYEEVDFDQPRRLRPAKSLESLHRVKTLPPRGVGNRYVDLNVSNPASSFSFDRPLPGAEPGWIQKQPLPPRPKQEPADDNLYSEIPEDLLAKRRMANGRWSPPARGERSFDNLYVTGPDVASDSTLPPNRTTSPYDKLPPRRPTPEVVASEGVAKAKELAKQGYELCLPSGEDPRTAARTPPIATPPRNIPRKNFSSGDVGMRPHRTMSGSAAGHMTQGPSEPVLGSSIPSDSTNLAADEYVIITRSDTRPKHSPKDPSSSSQVPSFPEGDDYEQMNPVKSQILLSHSSHYSTPNPSLHHNGEGASVMQASVEMATAATEEVSGASGHLYGNVERTDQDFSNLDRAARPGDKPLVRAQTLPPRRKTVSSSSIDSEVFVTTSQSSSVSGPMSIPEDERKLVPIASPESESSVQRYI